MSDKISENNQSKPKYTYTEFSSEFDGPRQFDQDHNEVPIKSLQQNVGEDSPQYDVEVGGKPWKFNFVFDIYVDVHKRVLRFWFPFYWGGMFLIVLPTIKLHKLWRKIV